MRKPVCRPGSFADAIHVDDGERAIQAFAPHGTVIPFEVEYRIVRPDGAVRWIRARGFPIRDERGDTYRFAGIAVDITERRSRLDLITRQAQALEQSNLRLSLLGEMTGLLQTVVRVEEAAAIIGGYLAQVRVGSSGALYLFKESRNYLDLLARWGELKLADRVVPRVPGTATRTAVLAFRHAARAASMPSKWTAPRRIFVCQ